MTEPDDPESSFAIDLEDIEDAQHGASELAEGSDVHDIDDLERQLGAASDIDSALAAYLQDADPIPDAATGDAPAAAVPTTPQTDDVPNLPRLLVRTDDRGGPRRR